MHPANKPERWQAPDPPYLQRELQTPA